MRRASLIGMLLLIGELASPTTLVAQSTICTSATMLSSNDIVTFDNSGVVNTPNPAFECIDDGGPPDGAVWFSFVATHMTARLSTCNSAAGDSTFAIYDSCMASAAIGRGEDECGTGGRLGDECIGGLIVGETYFVQVAAWSPDQRGSYTLEVQSPCPTAQTNLDCWDAQELLCGGQVTFDNTGLSHAPLPCYSCANGPDHTGTLWYKFTATRNSAVVSTCNSSADDSTLAVYSGPCDSLVELGCSEDTCGSSQFLSSSSVSGLIAGQTYYVQVSAWQPESRGSYTLDVECHDGSPGEIVPRVNGEGSRQITFSVTPATTATPGQAAIGIRMLELQHPQPPNSPCCPPPNFGSYEDATCTAAGETNGCVRWVGPPVRVLESQQNASLGSFVAARLQCTPHYADWTTIGDLVVFGAEIVPSSTYEVSTFSSSCKGVEPTCTSTGTPAQLATRRAGDVASPFSPPSGATQPDGLDVVAMVNKFRNLSGAPSKTFAQIQPNLVELNADLNAIDIVTVVDAFRGLAYGYNGPCPCPSPVTCETTPCTTPGQCSGGLCVKTCAGGTNADQLCLSNKHCNSCIGGLRDGQPCDPSDPSFCLGGSCSNDATCGEGFCRDRCGRCHD